MCYFFWFFLYYFIGPILLFFCLLFLVFFSIFLYQVGIFLPVFLWVFLVFFLGCFISMFSPIFILSCMWWLQILAELFCPVYEGLVSSVVQIVHDLGSIVNFCFCWRLVASGLPFPCFAKSMGGGLPEYPSFWYACSILLAPQPLSSSSLGVWDVWSGSAYLHAFLLFGFQGSSECPLSIVFLFWHFWFYYFCVRCLPLHFDIPLTSRPRFPVHLCPRIRGLGLRLGSVYLPVFLV